MRKLWLDFDCTESWDVHLIVLWIDSCIWRLGNLVSWNRAGKPHNGYSEWHTVEEQKARWGDIPRDFLTALDTDTYPTRWLSGEDAA